MAAVFSSIAMVGVPAFAQSAQADAAVESDEGAAIVVTGSRIVRRDYAASSPLVTVSSDTFNNSSSVTIETTLNQMPQFAAAGTASAASSAGGSFSGPGLALGAATLNLRGLGTNRTLVLVNGRRAQPISAQLFVDTNTIPMAALKNVEVITGGAASTYGADAIAGVVNFLLKDDYQGFEVDGRFGISEQGDSEQFALSALMGGNFDDGRGNIMLNLSWSDRRPGYQYKRGFYTDSWADPNTPGNANGVPLNLATVGGVQYGINPDGSLFKAADATNPAAPYTGPLGDLINGSGLKYSSALAPNGLRKLGFVYPDSWNTYPLTRFSAYSAGHYDLTEDLTFFFDAGFSHNKAVIQGVAGQGGSGFWNINVPYNQANDDPDSPTFGADKRNWHPVSRQLADALNAVSPTPSTWALMRGNNFAGRIMNETSTNVYQMTAGLRGKVGVKDWTWEVYGSHGNTSVVVEQTQGAVSLNNLQQIISGRAADGSLSPTVTGPYGQGWSSGALFNPQYCTSGIPLFDANGLPTSPTASGSAENLKISEDCLKYVTLEFNSVTRVKQDIVEANLQGALVNTWAGEARFALGASYRENVFNFTPDSGNSGEQSGLGVIGQIALPSKVGGKTSAKEVYGEVMVPLIRDLPLIKSFDLELGGRYSSYNYAGEIATFKVLGDWQVNDWLRLRGGFQRANRAPNAYELFAPLAASVVASHDACVNIGNGIAPAYGNLDSNPNQVNVQVACQELMIRSGAYPYRTLADDASLVSQPVASYPGIDQTRMSNFRWSLNAYGVGTTSSVGLNQGNPNLASEKANTFTLGAVIRSPFDAPALRRINLTIDYFSISMTDTIAVPNGDEVYDQCFNPANNALMATAPGTHDGSALLAGNRYCQYIQRYPFNDAGERGGVGSGADRTFLAPFMNKGALKTEGLDVAFDWTSDLQDLGLGAGGALNLNVSANFLLKYEEQAMLGGPVVSLKGTGLNLAFDYKLTTQLAYRWDGGSIGFRWFHLPEVGPSPYAARGSKGAKAHNEFGLFGTKKLTKSVDLRAGVDNLFNARPKMYGATPTDSASGTTLAIYDTTGRSFYIGAKARF
jgi:iron complex outermembrane receptor protein